MTTPRDRGAREPVKPAEEFALDMCAAQEMAIKDGALYRRRLKAIQDRDATHAAELAELRAKVIEECAQAIEGARILYDDIEDYNAQLAARIRALEVK